MVVFNYSGKEVSAKVVYYGPGLSGKTTNLEHIYGKVPEKQRGKMVSMKTKTDRTLFFDFLPLSAGEISGFKTRFLLYTVPGQVYYNATRKLVLKGADGIVFVADSDPELREANKESFANLEKNLAEHGMSLTSIPIVLQYNKRDVTNAMSIDMLNGDLNRGNWPVVEAVAIQGDGVFETFKEITRNVFQKMHARFNKNAGAAEPMETGVAPASVPPPPSAPRMDAPQGASAPAIHDASAPIDSETIRLSSMDRILGRSAPPIERDTPAPARAETPAAPQRAEVPAPARATDSDEVWQTHEVRIPITVDHVRAGRIRLVLDIDLIESSAFTRSGSKSSETAS
jgi:signal recognition particle receptor subunit beta